MDACKLNCTRRRLRRRHEMFPHARLLEQDLVRLNRADSMNLALFQSPIHTSNRAGLRRSGSSVRAH
jgi:hypothetical protein